MQNHGVGGYTSRAIGKRWNRRCEELADISERAGVISSYLGLTDYNQMQLTVHGNALLHISFMMICRVQAAKGYINAHGMIMRFQ